MRHKTLAQRKLRLIWIGLLLLTAVASTLVFGGLSGHGTPNDVPISTSDSSFEAPGSGHGNDWPVYISRPSRAPRVETSVVDSLGRPVTVSCSSCHATREPNYDNNRSSQLEVFHQNLTFKHGQLSCLSCHNPDNYDQLRRADGRALQYPQVMALCGQCHGPQARDYARGSHGGMTGYWDRSKGPRNRNNCVDCHDAHAPAYPKVRPVFPPKDRFAPASAAHDSSQRIEMVHMVSAPKKDAP